MKCKTLVLISIVLTSCSIYKQKFDCPPDIGIPCTSVSDLEQMIVETEVGPDVFLGVNPNQSQIEGMPNSTRIWMPDCKGRGRYFYFQERSCCKP